MLGPGKLKLAQNHMRFIGSGWPAQRQHRSPFDWTRFGKIQLSRGGGGCLVRSLA